jgi:hypothetical protein
MENKVDLKGRAAMPAPALSNVNPKLAHKATMTLQVACSWL